MAWVVDRCSLTRSVGWVGAVVVWSALVVASVDADDSMVAVPVGFAACDVLTFDPADGGVGGLAFTPDGDTIVHEGGTVRVHSAGGVDTLTTFDPPVFGSFLAVTPDGTSVLVGESSDNNIYRLPLAGGERVRIDNIRFNYSIAIDADGNGFVSAPNADFTLNQVWLIDGDPDTLSPPIVRDLPGFSGPLAVDAQGNLYYGTATLDCVESLFRFSRAQLQSAIMGTSLSVDDAETLITDAVGFAQMLYADDKLIFSELGFCTDPSVGRLWTVDLANNFLLEPQSEFSLAEGVLSPTFIAFQPGPEPFAAGNGMDGGRLVVASSDFIQLGKVTQIAPQLFFVRGRINGDLQVNVADVTSLLNFLFGGGSPPRPMEAGDVNDDGRLNIADVLYLLNFLFGSGPVISPPFPQPGPVS